MKEDQNYFTIHRNYHGRDLYDTPKSAWSRRRASMSSGLSIIILGGLLRCPVRLNIWAQSRFSNAVSALAVVLFIHILQLRVLKQVSYS